MACPGPVTADVSTLYIVQSAGGPTGACGAAGGCAAGRVECMAADCAAAISGSADRVGWKTAAELEVGTDGPVVPGVNCRAGTAGVATGSGAGGGGFCCNTTLVRATGPVNGLAGAVGGAIGAGVACCWYGCAWYGAAGGGAYACAVGGCSCALYCIGTCGCDIVRDSEL
jgi:hypothetical protein